MKKRNKILLSIIAVAMASSQIVAVCTSHIAMGGNNIINMNTGTNDVNITDANVTGKMDYAVTADDVRKYIKERLGK